MGSTLQECNKKAKHHEKNPSFSYASFRSLHTSSSYVRSVGYSYINTRKVRQQLKASSWLGKHKVKKIVQSFDTIEMNELHCKTMGEETVVKNGKISVLSSPLFSFQQPQQKSFLLINFCS